MENTFLNFLLELKTPLLIVLGMVVIYLVREIREYKKTIKLKDKQLNTLSEKVITVASLWDVKSDLNSKEHDTIRKLLGEIRDDVKLIKTNTDV